MKVFLKLIIDVKVTAVSGKQINTFSSFYALFCINLSRPLQSSWPFGPAMVRLRACTWLLLQTETNKQDNVFLTEMVDCFLPREFMKF